jgi:hypothetical protein
MCQPVAVLEKDKPQEKVSGYRFQLSCCLMQRFAEVVTTANLSRDRGKNTAIE